MKPRKRRVKPTVAAPHDDEVRVYISPVTFAMGVIFVSFGMAYEFVCSLTAVVIHEFAHARVAKKLGYALNEIRLMPYGAALCMNADITPKHEILIAAAGPIINLVLGLLFAALWWLVPTSYAFTQEFCLCNLYIGVFNLLPVYPLDGGRIVFALLASRVKRKKAYMIMRILSAAFGLISVALFIVSAVYTPNICFLTVGLFMVVSAFLPDERARYYELFAYSGRKERLKRPMEVKKYAVSGGAPVTELCKLLDPDRFCVFEIYGDDLSKRGELDESALIDVVKTRGYTLNAAQALYKDSPKTS